MSQIMQIQSSDRWRKGGLVLVVVVLALIGGCTAWVIDQDSADTPAADAAVVDDVEPTPSIAPPPEPGPEPDPDPEPEPEPATLDRSEVVVNIGDGDPAPITVAGRLPSEAVQAAVLAAVAEAFPDAEVTDLTVVDEAVGSAGLVLGVTGEVRTAEDAAANIAALSTIETLFDTSEVIDDQTVRVTDDEQAFENALNALVAAEPIQFATGSAELSPDSVATLDRVVTLFFETTEVPVRIDGHTDSQGNRDGNVALSQARAESVRQYLVDNGVDPERLTTQGFGPDQPVADNDTAERRAQNRRIEFTVRP